VAASSTNQVAVVELRQYRLVPGRRDEMIAIFERHLLEPQEDVGMRVLGHFRDQGDPERFVWLRGFRDMPSRRAALEAFYNGDLWHEHRDAVNATIVDSDDVLLLRPAAGSSFENGAQTAGGHRLIGATIWPFAQPVPAETLRVFLEANASRPAGAGIMPVALLVTEPSENDFPRLPVREGENVVVSLERIDDETAYEARAAALASALAEDLAGPPQTLRLEPAERSRLA
jgi:hypothetical protein